MAKSQTVLRRKDTTSNSALYISFDLGDKSWQISLGDDRFHVSRHTVAAGDTAAVASHNRRVRALLVEQAWSWLRLQPESELTLWFNRRFAASGGRMRRVGIVALARRLAIALWRYLKDGEIPAGAHLKSIAA
jgi:hypothetical protein